MSAKSKTTETPKITTAPFAEGDFVLLAKGWSVKDADGQDVLKQMDSAAPGDGVKAEAGSILMGMFEKGADVKGCMTKLKTLLKTHAMLTDDGSDDEGDGKKKNGDDEEVKKFLVEVVDRVDSHDEAIEGIDAKIAAAVDAKLAEIKKGFSDELAEIKKSLETDLTTVAEDLKELADCSGVLGKAA